MTLQTDLLGLGKDLGLGLGVSGGFSLPAFLHPDGYSLGIDLSASVQKIAGLFGCQICVNYSASITFNKSYIPSANYGINLVGSTAEQRGGVSVSNGAVFVAGCGPGISTSIDGNDNNTTGSFNCTPMPGSAFGYGI